MKKGTPVNDGGTKPKAPATSGPGQSDLLEDARSAAIDVVVEMLAGVHRARQHRSERDTGRGGCGDGDEDPRRVTIDGGATGGDLLFELARLQLDIVQEVLRFQRRHGEALFDRLYRTSRPQGTEAAAPLVLKGRVGDKAGATLVVENQGSKKAHVSLRLSQLRSRDGKAPFWATVDVQPAPPFDLDPDQERTVTVTVTLDAGHFQPGHRYRGEVEILMAGSSTQTVPVRIEVADDPATPGPSP